MKRRHSPIDQFSTFIHWEKDQFHHWQPIPHLQRNIQRYLDPDPSLTDTQYWVAFWHKRWVASAPSHKTANIYRDHLYAYLEEPCYRAADGLWQDYRQQFELELIHYFELGMLGSEKLLTEFNPILNPNLGAHSYTLFRRRMIDKLREYDKKAGHTQWSLLLNCTETGLKKALLRAGFTLLLDEYLMAWDCYCAIYSSAKIKHKGKIQSPSDAQWEQITSAFIEITSKSVQSKQVRKYIADCAQALLQSRSTIPISLNQKISKKVGDEERSELQDVVEDRTELERQKAESEWKAVQTQFQKIYVWLDQELTTLDVRKHRLSPQIKTILELYYGRNLKQIPIAQELKIDQATVSRNLKKMPGILADRFIQWCPEHLGRPVKVDDLKSIGPAIEQWLQHYYQRNVGTL